MPGDIAGRKVLNRYKIVEKLGGGGMSVVWKAYDLVLDRNVALKILRPEMSEDEDFIRRFRREAQSVASLSHPNIVNIYDVGEDRGLYFIVMELIGEGETLRDKLRAQGKMEAQEALEIVAGICEALSHAHARRIIHRDIKPQNILLTRQGHVKVADFGIARALGGISTTSRDVVVGSAPYISPEQAKNGVVSTRSDLYSLGVVLYEMLAGQPPFGGDSAVAVALQHVEACATPLREKYPSIPQVVDDLVRKAMAKGPDDRFQSAEEMLRAIKTIQAGGVPDLGGDRAREGAPKVPVGDGDLVRPKKNKRGLSLAVRIFVGLAAVALFAVGYALWMFNNWVSVPAVEVPNVVGKSQVEAQGLLKEAGLVFQISGERYDEKVPVSTVLTQSPLGGEKAKPGREVYCFLSKGQDFAKVPDVIGKDMRQVTVEFQNAGLMVGDVRYVPHATIPKDSVVSQNPRPGLDMPKSSTVNLEVSTGPEIPTAKVPRIIGMTLEEAQKALSDALLGPGTIAYQQGTGLPGVVLEQSPAAGVDAPLRSKVTMLVSGAVPVSKRLYTKTFSVGMDASSDGKPVRVRIWVTDAAGETLVYDNLVTPGSPEQTTVFQWQGSQATVKTEIGGKVSTETIRP